jgi:hypothetical protein
MTAQPKKTALSTAVPGYAAAYLGEDDIVRFEDRYGR